MSILSIKATCMRGGTSKCWVFERSELENRELSMNDIYCVPLAVLTLAN